MMDDQSEHLQLDGALMDGIPSWRLLEASQASGQPSRTLFVSLQVTQVIIGFPAYEKAHLRLNQDQEPGKARIALIKDMRTVAVPNCVGSTTASCGQLLARWGD